MFSIGEFSMISRLSIKTLRYYHQLGLLIPFQINEESGYRHYNRDNLKRAEQILLWKEMGFSLSEIQRIFSEEDIDLERVLNQKLSQIEKQLGALTEKKERIRQWQESLEREDLEFTEEIKHLDRGELGYLSVRILGTYDKIGEGFDLIFKRAAAYVTGPCFALQHQLEYKEKDAKMDACAPVQQPIMIRDLSYETLEAAPVLSLLHKGPYHTMGRSYLQLFQYCKDENLQIKTPLREIYQKGPGLDGWGDPEKYVTDIQLEYQT